MHELQAHINNAERQQSHNPVRLQLAHDTVNKWTCMDCTSTNVISTRDRTLRTLLCCGASLL